jgi:hypothetical protein
MLEKNVLPSPSGSSSTRMLSDPRDKTLLSSEMWGTACKMSVIIPNYRTVSFPAPALWIEMSFIHTCSLWTALFVRVLSCCHGNNLKRMKTLLKIKNCYFRVTYDNLRCNVSWNVGSPVAVLSIVALCWFVRPAHLMGDGRALWLQELMKEMLTCNTFDTLQMCCFLTWQIASTSCECLKSYEEHEYTYPSVLHLPG